MQAFAHFFFFVKGNTVSIFIFHRALALFTRAYVKSLTSVNLMQVDREVIGPINKDIREKMNNQVNDQMKKIYLGKWLLSRKIWHEI